MPKHEPMQYPKGRAHPSGRPLRLHVTDDTRMSVPPREEPLVPGLRSQRRLNVIGFLHDFKERLP